MLQIRLEDNIISTIKSRNIFKLYNSLESIYSSVNILNKWTINYLKTAENEDKYIASNDTYKDLKIILLNKKLILQIEDIGMLIDSEVQKYLLENPKSFKISLLVSDYNNNNDDIEYKTFSSFKRMLFQSLTIFNEENFETQLIHVLETAFDFEEFFSEKERNKLYKIQEKLENQLTKLLGK
jgi:hypothetical protein